MVDDLPEDVPVVEVHLVVDWIVDRIMIIALEFDISSIFELCYFVHFHTLVLHHLLLERSL